MASNEPVRVEQCDRNSAADFLERAGLLQSATHEHYTQGLMDGSFAVLAFARHRTLSQGDGRGEVEEAAQALIAKLDAVHADSRYEAVWTISQLHGVPYAGPTYTAELDALRAALTEVHQEKNDG